MSTFRLEGRQSCHICLCQTRAIALSLAVHLATLPPGGVTEITPARCYRSSKVRGGGGSHSIVMLGPERNMLRLQYRTGDGA